MMNTPIKIISKTISIIATAAIVTLGSGSNLSAATFTETFDNPTLSNQPADYIGWKTYATPSATDTSSVVGRTYVTPDDDLSIRLAYNNTDVFGSNLLTYLDATLSGVSSITFDARQILYSSSAPFTLRLAIQNAAYEWVVSNDTLTLSNNALGTVNTKHTFTYSTKSTEWRTLTIKPGKALSVGSVLEYDLRSTDIKAIGFYVEGNGAIYNGIIKLDNLVVTASAIPEAQ